MAKSKLIVNLTRGHCVCVGELADQPLRRMRGLIGRRGLPAGEGLLLRPAPAIHTAFMRFPIDALFLDRNLRVLDIVERLRPWRFASRRRAHAVLELSAGECARRGVEVGDRLELRERTAIPASGSDVSDAADTDVAGPAITPVPQASTRPPTAEGWTPKFQAGELARLLPLGVLVISHDRHFRSVMSLLLARRNCSVTTTANAGRVAELIARESADVVLIDASRLPSDATVATIDALARPVGVVLVADEAHSGPPGPPVLAKWGPFTDLVTAIERADEGRAAWRQSDAG